MQWSVIFGLLSTTFFIISAILEKIIKPLIENDDDFFFSFRTPKTFENIAKNNNYTYEQAYKLVMKLRIMSFKKKTHRKALKLLKNLKKVKWYKKSHPRDIHYLEILCVFIGFLFGFLAIITGAGYI